MKRSILLIILLAASHLSFSQITITAADMPVVGDTLRSSISIPYATTIDLNNTGSNISWDFSSLAPIAQQVDTFQGIGQINALATILYGISSTAYGYKSIDSIPFIGSLLPVSIDGIYELFDKKTNPDRYIKEGVSTNISGLPFASKYTDPDELYFFPLAYGNTNTSTYYLPVQVPTIGGLTENGTRTTTVDAWGTIITPYYTTAVSCIRIRSEINEVDSVSYNGTTFGMPRTSVDYQWLVNGEHYPALWVTTTVVGGVETITAVRYRDIYRSGLLGIAKQPAVRQLKIYPNPATNGIIKIDVPTMWPAYTVEVFDMQGRRVAVDNNTNVIDIATQPSGQYMVRVTSGDKMGCAFVTK